MTRLEMREASKVLVSRMRYLPDAEIDSAFYGFDKAQGCWSSEMMKSTFRHVICKKSVSCDVAAKSEKHIQEALRIDAKTGFGGDGEGLAVTHGAVFDKLVSMCSEIDEKAAEWEGSNVSRIKEAAVEIWESECIAQVEFKDALGFPRRAFVNLANQKVHLCDVAAESAKPVLEKLTRQARDGDAEMQNVLGQIYARYTAFKYIPVEKDAELAAAWFLRAAKGGCADAMDNLGNCLKNGDGVEKDVELSFAWYLKAAKKGLAWGQFHAASGFFNGTGVEKDLELARHWYFKAAKQGLADAQNMAGRCAEEGWGMEKDPEMAFSWYLQAAKNGHATAMHNLSICYGSGIGCEKDAAKKEEWRKKAREYGYVEKNTSGW